MSDTKEVIPLDLQVQVLREGQSFDEYLSGLRAEVLADLPRPDTEAGRKEIRSRSYRVARIKTTIDEAGKSLNEEARRQIGIVDAQRRRIRDALEGLQADINAEMTAYLEAEEKRLTRITRVREAIARAHELHAGSPVIQLSETSMWLASLEVDDAVFQADGAAVREERTRAIAHVAGAIAAARKLEAERAELEALRREKAERERQEAEKARREMEERLAVERKAQAAIREAAERERRAADEKAAAEAAEQARRQALADGLAAEQAEKAAREAAAARVEALRAEQAREQERLRGARAARDEAIKAALIAEGEIDDQQAAMLLLALLAGDIPHVTVAEAW